jgi:AraC-like DNA-binding protein
MPRRFRVSRLLVSRLEELGIAPGAVVRQAAIPASVLSDERILLTTEQLFAFWSAVATLSGNPLIGLVLGSEARVERYDAIAMASLSATSVRDAIGRAARFKQLTCPEEIVLAVRGRECAIQFRWLLAEAGAPAALTDLCFAWILTLARRGTGGVITPLRVELNRPAAHRDDYEAHFGCAVRFSAGRDALVLDARDLDRPFLTSNSDLLAVLAPQLEAELTAQLASADPADEVKAILKRLLTGRRPALREVARAMGASVRTLQRRLAQSGASYQQVLEDARRELAHHYLQHSSLDLSETAYVLGYEDASSFFRAFHQWEGTTPGRWREKRRRRRPLVDVMARSRDRGARAS